MEILNNYDFENQNQNGAVSVAAQTAPSAQAVAHLFNSFDNLDALKVFYILSTVCQTGQITIFKIVTELERLGFFTARGDLFTYSTVYNRLQSLVTRGLVELYKPDGATICARLARSESGARAVAVLPIVTAMTAQETCAASRVDAHTPTRARAINNNNNIYNKINKQNAHACAREKFIEDNTESDEQRETVTVDDLVNSVDLTSATALAIRQELVTAGWEVDAHAALFDRATAAILLKLNGATVARFKRAISDARAKVALYSQTCGRRGRAKMWQVWALEVKRVYDEVGAAWTATDFKSEPRPIAKRAVMRVDAQKSLDGVTTAGRRSWLAESVQRDENGKWIIGRASV